MGRLEAEVRAEETGQKLALMVVKSAAACQYVRIAKLVKVNVKEIANTRFNVDLVKNHHNVAIVREAAKEINVEIANTMLNAALANHTKVAKQLARNPTNVEFANPAKVAKQPARNRHKIQRQQHQAQSTYHQVQGLKPQLL